MFFAALSPKAFTLTIFVLVAVIVVLGVIAWHLFKVAETAELSETGLRHRIQEEVCHNKALNLRVANLQEELNRCQTSLRLAKNTPKEAKPKKPRKPNVGILDQLLGETPKKKTRKSSLAKKSPADE